MSRRRRSSKPIRSGTNRRKYRASADNAGKDPRKESRRYRRVLFDWEGLEEDDLTR